jgi:hypothetical protein
MEGTLECMLKSLDIKSKLISQVLVAVKTKNPIEKIEHREKYNVHYFSFQWDLPDSIYSDGYCHAVGLHECLTRVKTEYVMFLEPDVVIYKSNFDEFYLDIFKEHNLTIIGVSRAADPRGLKFMYQQCFGGFPTVINCLTKTEYLPGADFLKGYLKLRPHVIVGSNLEEETYVSADGKWLLQSPIPQLIGEFPNPRGAFPVGCNLWLWFKKTKWLAFTLKENTLENLPTFCNATTYNINNFGLSNDIYKEEPLLFHAGHKNFSKLHKALEEITGTSSSSDNNCKCAVCLEYIPPRIKIMQPPVAKPPYRSPMAVSDAIKDLIKDKVVCELGCAEGDNLVFMARYAKKVIGFEYMKRRYQVAQKRGLDVTVGDYYKDPLPDADVYYFWPDDGEKDSEYLVQKLLKKPGFNGIIIVGADPGFPPEVPSLGRCARWGQLIEVPYDEGKGHREHGTFLLAIIDIPTLQQQCTLLLSSPRAGSSATAGSLNLCGLHLGKNVTEVKDTWNKKGYFENQSILTFNEKVLRAVGSNIFATATLDEKQTQMSLHHKEELKQLLKTEFGEEKFFLIKDPRINILQKLYTDALIELDIKISTIILTRPQEHAAKSMSNMTGISEDRAKNSYTLHYQLAEQLAANKPTARFSFQDLIKNPNKILKQACYALQIPYGEGRHNQTNISQFVEKGLVNHG